MHWNKIIDAFVSNQIQVAWMPEFDILMISLLTDPKDPGVRWCYIHQFKEGEIWTVFKSVTQSSESEIELKGKP
jgi:catabolite regulation protein CreA